MISLVVLGLSLVVLRAAGRLGVPGLASWRAASRGALALMFAFTGGSHFTGLKHDFAAMIPPPLPDGLWVIYATGALEIAGGLALLHPRTRRAAGLGLALLLVALFPANVHAALNAIPLGGRPPTALWLRAPLQLLYLGLVWWAALGARPRRPSRASGPASEAGSAGGVRPAVG
jgi:uncharacterized membrane protein